MTSHQIPSTLDSDKTSLSRAVMKPAVVTFTNLTSDTEVTLSCYEVYYGYRIESITRETVSAFRDLLSEACCAYIASEFYTCSICGDGDIAVSDATVEYYGENVSCSVIVQAGKEGYLSPPECRAFSEDTDVTSICCDNTPLASPTVGEPSASPSIDESALPGPTTDLTNSGIDEPRESGLDTISPSLMIATGMMLMTGAFIFCWF